MNPKLLRTFAAAVAVGAIGIGCSCRRRGRQRGSGDRRAVLPRSRRLDDAGRRAAARAGAAAVLAEMAKKDVVLLGEQHDEDDDHRWQLQVLAALHAQRPDMVIGFEMFPRRAQPVLDDWVAGKLTVRQLLEQSQWESVWKLPAELYLPLFQFARINRIPMVALNVDRKLTRAIARERLGRGARRRSAKASAGRRRRRRRTAISCSRSMASTRTVTARTARRRSRPTPPSAASSSRRPRGTGRWPRRWRARVTPDRRARSRWWSGIMGSGHIRFGHGVPHQLRDLGVKNVGTLLPVPAGLDCKELRPGLADAVFAVPETAKAAPEPPRLGVRLEEKEGAVRIVDVTAGSLAERTGLRRATRSSRSPACR